MSKSQFSIFFILGTLCVMIALSLLCNSIISASAADDARDTCSDVICALVVPDQAQSHGTIVERISYAHDAYFGLRG